VGALATKTAGISSSTSPHEVSGGALNAYFLNGIKGKPVRLALKIDFGRPPAQEILETALLRHLQVMSIKV
jgi:hypothetical protein